MTAPIRIISSMATRTLLAEIASRYRDRNGVEVHIESVGAVTAVKRIEAGDAFDGAVLSSTSVSQLIAGGCLLAPRTDFARSGVAVAVKAGAPRPDIRTEDAVRRAVLLAPTVGYSTGASGAALARLFARWGITDQIRSRLVVPPPGIPVGSLLASGELALGFQQLSELMFLDGIDIVGMLPDAIQVDTVFAAAQTVQAAQAHALTSFFAFLNESGLVSVKQAHGMSPV